MSVEEPRGQVPGVASPSQQQQAWPTGSPAPAPGGGYFPATQVTGAVGKVRGTGVCILLMIVTLGIYGLFWYYQTHEEMKRHSGQGLGGGLALVIAIIVGIAMPYLTSNEVGGLYERRGQAKPVSALTGLWYFPGIFLFFIGPIVWFVKTNGALNAYWRSLGAH
jgi:F0F1-type ATP synthase membrane subunit c/vacuolar-type H+-ATPase subunit K